MAVSSTFESSLRRGNPTTTSTSRRTTPPSSTSASSNSSRRVAAAPPLRSRSVSAFSRTSNSDFSIKRDNPLFDNNGNGNDDDAGFPSSGLGSDRFTSKTKAKATATDGCNDKRGRSVSGFDSDGKHGLGSWNSKGLSRSLSVVDTKRRGRSVSRNPPLSRAQFATSESEGEQEGNSWTKSKNKCNLIATSGDGGNLVRSRSSLTRSGQLNRMEPSDFHTSLL